MNFLVGSERWGAVQSQFPNPCFASFSLAFTACSYLLFLGADGQGNMVPARQLRDKYCVGRRDVYAPGESRWEEQEEEDGGSSGSDGNNGGGGGSGPEGSDGAPPPAGGAGRRKIPGIDMSSLD